MVGRGSGKLKEVGCYLVYMSNPASFQVYYDEDEERSHSSIRDELNESISEMEGVNDVSVEKIIETRPNVAVVRVDFDESKTFVDDLEYEISTLPFIHNASTKV